MMEQTEKNDEDVSAARAAVSSREHLEKIRTAVLSGIFFLLIMYTFYLAASLILPIVLALLLSLVLSPLVGLLAAVGVPRALGGLLAMLSIAALMAAGVYAVGAPAAQWIDKAPEELRKLEYKLAWVKEPIREINKAREQVDELAGGDGNMNRQSSFSVIDAILSRTPDVMFGVAVMLILLFFLLAAGDNFLNKLVRVMPDFQDKRRIVTVAREIQHHVSVYLGTITLINVCVGVVVGFLMYWLEVPNPALWGAMAGTLNFIPYLGVAITILIVGFVSILTFETIGHMLLPPLAIFGVNIVEGQFLTPIIAGRRLALSPVAIFLTVVVLGWIWGLIGVLIAVPVLVIVKLVCEHIAVLEPVALLLSRE
jgi:predicted PurR-regulated permease PerM